MVYIPTKWGFSSLKGPKYDITSITLSPVQNRENLLLYLPLCRIFDIANMKVTWARYMYAIGATAQPSIVEQKSAYTN